MFDNSLFPKFIHILSGPPKEISPGWRCYHEGGTLEQRNSLPDNAHPAIISLIRDAGYVNGFAASIAHISIPGFELRFQLLDGLGDALRGDVKSLDDKLVYVCLEPSRIPGQRWYISDLYVPEKKLL